MNYLPILSIILISIYLIVKKTNQYIKNEIRKEYEKERKRIAIRTHHKVLSERCEIRPSFSNN